MTGSNTVAAERIFLVGWYGTDNLGDDAILDAVVAASRALGISIDRFSTRRVTADPRAVCLRSREFWRYVTACRRATRVVLGGGGILKDEGLGPLLEFLLTAVLARVFRRPVALLSVGVGPFYGAPGRLLIGAIARLASVRVVRDRESAAYLHRLGIRNVHVAADPIFSLSSAARAATELRRRRHRALFCVRPWFHIGRSKTIGTWDAFAESLATIARGLLRAGWQVHFACLYWPQDREAAFDVVARVSADSRITVQSHSIGWSELVDDVRDAGVVIAMRYHCIAVAALAGVPTVALSYEPKVAALARELGLPRVSLDEPSFAERVEELAAGDAARVRESVPPPDADALADLEARAWKGLRLALGGEAAEAQEST